MNPEIKVSVTLPDLPTREVIQTGIFRGLQQWFHILEARAKALAPVKTGTLRDQIQSRVWNESARIIAGKLHRGRAFYGHILEYGVGSPYEIVAKGRLWRHSRRRRGAESPTRAKALRFRMGGAIVFAQRVQHPGIAARPHFQPALSMSLPQLAPMLATSLQEEFARSERERHHG